MKRGFPSLNTGAAMERFALLSEQPVTLT